jgi:peptidyl-prolyl cis-trans isomerase A (cyclophilin A)
MKNRLLTLLAAVLFAVVALAGPQSKPPAPKSPAPSQAAPPPTSPFDRALLTPASLNAKAPDTFDVKFVTTKGEFVVHVTRDWAPNGADRFYNLVKHHYFDGVAFFRVLRTPRPFMAQCGFSPYPEVNTAWMSAYIKDDPVKQSNKRGMVTYAALPTANGRSTQIFINYADNSFLDQSRFAPFGEVVSGMEVVDQFYGGYGDGPPEGRGPSQDMLSKQGQVYLSKNFPNLDSIKTARIVTTPAPATPKSPGN